jgi:hypothetical protein
MDPEWDRKWQRMGIKWTLAQEKRGTENAMNLVLS